MNTMIKFFRKIRHKLIHENRLGKYLVYALGEIVLVVIGILFALQVNNWNEIRKAEVRSKQYLQSTVDDLRTDTTGLQEVIDFTEMMILRKFELLAIKDYSMLSTDSIFKSIIPISYNIRLNDRTYQKLKNAQVTELVGYENVLDSINRYYTADKNLYTTILDWDISQTNKEADYWFYHKTFENLYNEFLFNDTIPLIQSEDKQHDAIVESISSVEGRNRIRISLFRKQRLKGKATQTKAQAVQLIRLINRKLNR